MRVAERGLFERLQWFKDRRAALLAILLVNLGGIAYGFYYYGAQFRVTPVWLWIFVPDSPLAVLWAALALVLYALKRRSDVVDSLAFVANVQVGLWTAYVLSYFAADFGTWDPADLNFALLWLHFAMVALAFLFVRDLRASFAARPSRAPRVLGGVLAWTLLNDAIDYFGPDFVGAGCGMRPYTVPCRAADEPILTLVTFGLTLLAVGALAWLTWPKRAARVPA